MALFQGAKEVVRVLREFKQVLPMLGYKMPEPDVKDSLGATFEATVEASRQAGAAVVPEIMIPLVSDVRELRDQKAVVDRVVLAFREADPPWGYRLPFPGSCRLTPPPHDPSRCSRRPAPCPWRRSRERA